MFKVYIKYFNEPRQVLSACIGKESTLLLAYFKEMAETKNIEYFKVERERS